MYVIIFIDIDIFMTSTMSAGYQASHISLLLIISLVIGGALLLTTIAVIFLVGCLVRTKVKSKISENIQIIHKCPVVSLEFKKMNDNVISVIIRMHSTKWLYKH